MLTQERIIVFIGPINDIKWPWSVKCPPFRIVLLITWFNVVILGGGVAVQEAVRGYSYREEQVQTTMYTGMFVQFFLDEMYFYDHFMPYFMPLEFCWYLYKQKSSDRSNIWSIGQNWPRGQNTDLNISITRGQRGNKILFWGPLIFTFFWGKISAKSGMVASNIN